MRTLMGRLTVRSGVAVKRTEVGKLRRMMRKVLDGRLNENVGVEIAVLEHFARYPHPNLVALAAPASEGGIVVYPDALEVRMQAFDTDLFEFLERHGPPRVWEDVLEVLTQMCAALEHMHRLGLAHGDVSLENFVVRFSPHSGDRPWQCVDIALCDFAQVAVVSDACPVNLDVPEKVAEWAPLRRLLDVLAGSPWRHDIVRGKQVVRAPEVNQWCRRPLMPYDPRAADVFSLGVCFAIVLTNCTMMNFAHRRDPLYNAHIATPGGVHAFMALAPCPLPGVLVDVLEMMLSPKASLRPTMDTVRLTLHALS